MSLFKVDFTTTQSLSSYFKTQLQVAQFFTTNQTLHADKFTFTTTGARRACHWSRANIEFSCRWLWSLCLWYLVAARTQGFKIRMPTWLHHSHSACSIIFSSKFLVHFQRHDYCYCSHFWPLVVMIRLVFLRNAFIKRLKILIKCKCKCLILLCFLLFSSSLTTLNFTLF